MNTNFSVDIKGQAITTLKLDLGEPLAVKVYSPYETEKSSGLKKACPKDLTPIEQPARCKDENCEYHNGFPEDDQPVLIAYEGTEAIVISEDDLKELPLIKAKKFAIDSVVAFKEVEHLTYYAQGLYVLVPEDAIQAITYNSVMGNLRKSKRVIMGKFILKSNSRSETLGMIRVMGDCLVIQMVPFAVDRRALPIMELPDVTRDDNERVGDMLDAFPSEFDYIGVQDRLGAAYIELRQNKLREKMKKVKGARPKKGNGTKTLPLTSNRDAMEELFGGKKPTPASKVRRLARTGQ